MAITGRPIAVVALAALSVAPLGLGRAPTATADGKVVDYAVIKFDPAKVAPTAEFAGYPINGIGPDATYGQRACRDSQRDDVNCVEVSTAGADPDTMLIHACGNPDDSGAPVTVDDLLVGMIRGYFPDDTHCPRWWSNGRTGFWEIPQVDKPEVTSFNAILADVNAKGGPGAGFTPTPA